jgi:hypothetical protein
MIAPIAMVNELKMHATRQDESNSLARAFKANRICSRSTLPSLTLTCEYSL